MIRVDPDEIRRGLEIPTAGDRREWRQTRSNDGSARSAYHEGAHGVFENGYGLLKYKRWFRTTAHVRYETAMVWFVQDARARWQRRMTAGRAAVGPPPLHPRVA